MKKLIIIFLLFVINYCKSDFYLQYELNWHDIHLDSPHSGGSVWDEPINWSATLDGEPYDNVLEAEFPGTLKMSDETMVPNMTIIRLDVYTRDILDAHMVLNYYTKSVFGDESDEKIPWPITLNGLVVENFPLKIYTPLFITKIGRVTNSTFEFLPVPEYTKYYDTIFQAYNTTFSSTKMKILDFERPANFSYCQFESSKLNIRMLANEFPLATQIYGTGYSVFSTDHSHYLNSKLTFDSTTSFSSGDIYENSIIIYNNSANVFQLQTNFISSNISLDFNSYLFIYGDMAVEFKGNSNITVNAGSYIKCKDDETNSFNFYDTSSLILKDYVPRSIPMTIKLHDSSTLQTDCATQEYQWLNLKSNSIQSKIHSNYCKLILSNGLNPSSVSLTGQIQIDSSTLKTLNSKCKITFLGVLSGYHGYIDSPVEFIGGSIGSKNSTFSIKIGNSFSSSNQTAMNFYVNSHLDYSVLSIEAFALLKGKINVAFNPSFNFLPTEYSLLKYTYLNDSSLEFNVENKNPKFKYEFKVQSTQVVLIVTSTTATEANEASYEIGDGTAKPNSDKKDEPNPSKSSKSAIYSPFLILIIPFLLAILY